MSRTDFRDILLENILGFLWRQWSTLGVLGEAGIDDPWAIDPEALLLFTFPMARYEPRLFDEVMDWLTVNSKWIDIQRLRGILRRGDYQKCRSAGAAAAFLASRGHDRKWGNLASFCETRAQKEPESLFRDKSDKPYPAPTGGLDESFARFGYRRPPFATSGKSREVIPTARATIRFMLRALFGVGSRAECVLYLLTHDGGHPSEVANSIGFSVRGTQDALIELAGSGLVLTRIRGKRKIEYWISHDRWWNFLSPGLSDNEKPRWLDWLSIFDALSVIWEALNEIQRTRSAYIRSSKLRDAMDMVGKELAASGLNIPTLPGRNVRPEQYQEAAQNFIAIILGLEEQIRMERDRESSQAKAKQDAHVRTKRRKE